jgi:transposase, IS5 family
MAKAQKYRASKLPYISEKQLILTGFEAPFSRSLRQDNRWIVLAHKIPWDTLVSVYLSQLGNSQTGADGINPRVAIGSMIIKHICNLSDRETVQQIQENMYMQYFLGYSSFSDEEPFDPSLFVDFRKRLGIDQINEINEKILGLPTEKDKDALPPEEPCNGALTEIPKTENQETNNITHKGKLISDATACPQDIAYPTDLNLLSDAREKSEELIDILYQPIRHKRKPRTYRETARKQYLRTAQKKVKSTKEIRKAVKKQLAYLGRNIKSLYKLLDAYKGIPLSPIQYKYLLVIQTLHEQQLQMYKEQAHSIEHRIVSIHQPHVRPIVRGKTNAKVEFGAKIQISLMNGYTFLDKLSWDAFNESTCLLETVEKYKSRLGYYPEEVLVDKIYCTRANRKSLKDLGIKLKAKPLGRPKAVEEEHVRPGERNPIEGKFGQAKTRYGMNRIKARLSQTSESWIATIVLVLNLVKLAGERPLALLLSFRAYLAQIISKAFQNEIFEYKSSDNFVYRCEFNLT